MAEVSALRNLGINLNQRQGDPQRIPIYRNAPEYIDRANNPQNYPVINNPNGSISTHRMAAEVDGNGNWYVFPTVQMIDGILVEFNDSREAMEQAFKTGNILKAPSKQAALSYAEGGYKQGTNLSNYQPQKAGLQGKFQPIVSDNIVTPQEAVEVLESRGVEAAYLPFESSWSPFDPNFRSTVRSSLNDLFGGSNIASNSGYRRGRIADALAGLVDFAPAIGDAVGVGDTMTSYKQGDMLGTGINALATGVGVLPLVGGPASRAVKAGGNRVRSALRGIDAWHGSPHEFDSFSTDKIGTGTGLQAYGDGLYFAGNPERAIGYAELTREVDNSLMPAVANFFENDYSLSKAKAGMKSAYPNATNTELDNALNEYYMHLDDQGYMYNVNLNVNPEDLLDSDIPLTDQSEKIRQMAANHLDLPKASSPSKQAYIDEKMGMTGNEFYRRVESDLGNADAASNAFSDADIKGIKYKAGRGEGANNYVMFDDSLVDTKRVNDKLTDSWMNPEARMARADKGGFEEDIYYKGMYPYDYTKESGNYAGPEITEINRPDEFPAFNKGEEGVDIAGFLTKDPEVANRFAGSSGSGAVYPLRYRRGEVYTIDANGRNAGELQFGESGKEFRDAVRSGNYDTIEIINTADEGDITISTKPKNIRSTNAEFDPTKADSSDLLSSISPTQSSLRNIA